MATYRVRDGQQLAHEGQVLEGGATVELSRRVAAEVAHLVDEVGPASPAWAEDAEAVRAHERASALQPKLVAAQLKAELAADAAARSADECERAKAYLATCQREVETIREAIASATREAERPAKKPSKTAKPDQAAVSESVTPAPPAKE